MSRIIEETMGGDEMIFDADFLIGIVCQPSTFKVRKVFQNGMQLEAQYQSLEEMRREQEDVRDLFSHRHAKKDEMVESMRVTIEILKEARERAAKETDE